MASRSSVSSKACDSCRERKVKCDSQEQCANCRISNIDCLYTRIAKKRGPRRSRPVSVETSLLHGASIASPVPATASLHIGTSTQVHNTAQQSTAAWQTPSPAAWSTAPTDPDSLRSAQAISDTLVNSLATVQPAICPIDIASDCIDLYMQYAFPTAPLVHEVRLRSDALYFFASTHPAAVFETASGNQGILLVRGFTLLTSLCASVSSMMPAPRLAYGNMIDRLFLKASRDMLKIYEDFDLEFPDATSIAIRSLQSSALQHITGRKGAAFHVFGQATLLAQSMHLYNEQAIARDDPVESKLLRLNFWASYSSDKAGQVLGTRSTVLHELLLPEKISTSPYGEQFTPLLETTNPRYGFHLMPRLWSATARLLLSFKTSEPIARVADRYLEFVGIIDDLPSWLQVSNLMPAPGDTDANTFQKTYFWVQRCTLMMSFNCLRLVILQSCIEHNACEVMGLTDQPLAGAMKKMEIIQEFLQTADDIPLVYHQIKGEPSVERIRHVGTILLEMMQNVDNELIRARANMFFTRLLDLLAKLDSKASAELSR
ncbi:Pc16g08120 [Penicillium rubens Wisconsin 54-1255]|uniref:Pc16g08120 protein n=1 Tax=Penicillium rubens (strain ATCC 28089 / DSM 1075 / NRRL 1951 / Wisconsin 54-1255) TaxID=500485 RepID=B6H7R4_PENRW|nr:Pc16g08120 [Penicillium rubens Wisconsin 54-1255]